MVKNAHVSYAGNNLIISKIAVSSNRHYKKHQASICSKMNPSEFTEKELAEISKYFGVNLKDLDSENFKTLRNQLRSKYHPDKFEKYEDDTVREMAKERFQEIERLSEKIKDYLERGGKFPENTVRDSKEQFLHPRATYGFEAMQIDIRTGDKDMKYHLFGTQYRWLEMGEKFKIPGTNAYVIIEADHRGRSIGYTETVRIFLTFGAHDSIETIIDWLYYKIIGRASSLIIEGNVIPIDKAEMSIFIRRTSFLQIEQGGGV